MTFLNIMILSLIAPLLYCFSSVYSDPCQRVIVTSPRLQAECCLIKHEPDIVGIPQQLPSKNDLKNFYHSRPHALVKRVAPDFLAPKGLVGHYNEPTSCQPTQVNVQKFQGDCCVSSTGTWFNALQELNDLLSGGRFDSVPKPDGLHNLNNGDKGPENQQLQDESLTESNGTAEKAFLQTNITKQNEELSENRGNRTLALTEKFFNQGVITTIKSTVPPLSFPIDENSSFVFPTEMAPIIDEQNENNMTAPAGNTTVEFPNRNAIDVPKVCPKGQGRDASGQCLADF